MMLFSPRRMVLGVYAAAFSVDAAAYGYFVLVPLQAVHAFGAREEALGYLGTAVTLVYGVTCALSGRASDRVGSTRLYLSGLALLALGVVPLAYRASSLAHLLLANLLFGFGLGLFWPPLQRQLSLIARARADAGTGGEAPASRREPPVELWRHVGTYNCCWAAGIAAGTLATPVLHERAGFTAGLGWVEGLLVLALVSLLGVRAPRGAVLPAKAPRDAGAEGTGRVRAVRFLWLAWIANFAAYFSFQGLCHVFPATAERLDFSRSTLGEMLFLVGLARLGMFVLLRLARRWQYSLPWLLGVEALTAASLLGLAFARAPAAFYLLLPWVGALSGLSSFSSLYYGLNAPMGEGRASGLHEAIQAVGMASGPLACGLAGAAFPSWPGAVLAAAALGVLAALALQAACLAATGREGRQSRRTPLYRPPPGG